MELLLNDKQVDYLIKLLKNVIKTCEGNLTTEPEGTISIKSVGESHREFLLNYKYALNDIHLNFSDSKTKLTLVRINLDQRFHKNANGEHIKGNRVEIFSEKEFFEKNDGFTHYKAFKLPYKSLKNTNDFFEALHELLVYTNTNDNDKIALSLYPESKI